MIIGSEKNLLPPVSLSHFLASTSSLSDPAMASEQGIAALFSMYNDDDEEEENEDSLDQSNPPPSNRNSSPRSPLLPDEPSSDHKTLNSPLPPNPSQIPSPLSAQSSPPLSPVPTFADRLRARKGALGIVDYGHDEMAVSPEHDVSFFFFNYFSMFWIFFFSKNYLYINLSQLVGYLKQSSRVLFYFWFERMQHRNQSNLIN